MVIAAGWAGTTSVSGGTVGWIAVGLCALAPIPAGLRWVRVAQREHYLPGAVSRFAWRWWVSRPSGVVLGVAAVVCAGLAVEWPVAAMGTAIAGAVGPIGLRIRARTAPLAWTPRLIRLAAVFALLQAAIVGIVSVVLRAPAVSAFALLASPRVMDLACAFMLPVESRLVRPYLDRARDRLARVRPRIVAVTGSYGKTSTKQAIAHILSGIVNVVASPASFNNRTGLARAVNEHLADGTDVFVAEMGTYRPGEIAALCEWLPPEVAVITAIGPVHLERFGSEDRVLGAKSEILVKCDVAVLATDDSRLAGLADRLSGEGRRVVRCSAKDASADVLVEREGGPKGTLRVTVHGRVVGEGLHNSGRESNLACAV